MTNSDPHAPGGTADRPGSNAADEESTAHGASDQSAAPTTGGAGGPAESRRARIERFASARRVAVIGASRDRKKFGNRVLRTWLAAGREVHAVHPRETMIEGVRCVPRIADLPGDGAIDVLSVITPPAAAVEIVEQAAAHGIDKLWFQPGASSPEAIARADELGVETLHDGPCVLVELS